MTVLFYGILIKFACVLRCVLRRYVTFQQLGLFNPYEEHNLTDFIQNVIAGTMAATF